VKEKAIPTDYGPTVNALLAEPRLMALGPGTPDTSAKAALQRFDPIKDLGGPVADRDAARACLAGLWLSFDYLDEAHTVCQENEGHPERDFWHGVMHRREPDADNSKYWWRRVGTHPVLDQLRAHSTTLGYTFISAGDFVDFCEGVRDTESSGEELAQRVQLLEWQLLFDWCYRKACGLG
jgi:hypothetical protein